MPSPNPEPIDGEFEFVDLLDTVVSLEVYTKERWADTWVENFEINVTDVRWTAAPGVPTATLVYRYGPATRRDGSGKLVAENRPQLTLGGYYVKIVVECGDGDRVWIGYVDDTIDSPSGVVTFETVVTPVGTQTFSCLGMLASLGRTPITHCYFQSTGGNQGPGLTNRRVALSAPSFNPSSQISGEPGERRQIKNRAPTAVAVHDFRPTGASYSFQTRDTFLLHCETLYSQSGATGALWTTKQIVEYLVAYHGPRDADGKERIPIWLDTTYGAQIPNWDKPQLDCEGKTLKDALDALLNSSKSLGYTTYVDESTTPHRLYIQPFTTTEVDITIGANTVDANLDQLDITVQADAATSFNVQRTESALANQIVCRGAKRVVVTTLKIDQTMLKDGWPADLVTAFNSEFALLGEDYYSQYAKRDALEQGKYRPLYRNFTIHQNWNWKYADEFAALVDLFKIDDSDVTKSYDIDDRYLPFGYAIKLLANLPLKTGLDYATGTDTAPHLSSTNPFREIEVYGLGHQLSGSSYVMTGRAVEWTHRAKRDVIYDAGDPDYRLNANPLPSDVGLGVALDVSNAPQSILDPTSSIPALGGVPRLPRESLNVTVAFEEDRHVSQHWPDTAGSTLDSVLRKVFDFGDAYQVIELCDETILGLAADGTFKRRSSRWFVRDDRPALLDLAKQIAKWYETPRNVARIRSRRMTSKLWPGQLIKKINPTLEQEFTTNCYISEIGMTFAIGSAEGPGKTAMAITTSKGEFDPRFFVPKLKS